jgi:TPR repeat protein
LPTSNCSRCPPFPRRSPQAGRFTAVSGTTSQSQLRLAKAYNEGAVVNGAVIVRQNRAKALKWFQAASAQGSAEASAWLGSLYLLGHGVPQDLTRASALIQSAVAGGDPVGLVWAGFLYETGEGVARDYQKAAAYYSEAVAKSEIHAFDRLGSLYLRGAEAEPQSTSAGGGFMGRESAAGRAASQ